MNDSLLKELYGIKDARSTQGIFARGRNIYRGASTAAHSGGGPQFGRPKKVAHAGAIQRRRMRKWQR